MKFLSCSQCLNGIEEARSNVMSKPSCDPLLITKRPDGRTPATENSHRRISIPEECHRGNTEGRTTRVARLPKMLRVALNAASIRRRTARTPAATAAVTVPDTDADGGGRFGYYCYSSGSGYGEGKSQASRLETRSYGKKRKKRKLFNKRTLKISNTPAGSWSDEFLKGKKTTAEASLRCKKNICQDFDMGKMLTCKRDNVFENCFGLECEYYEHLEALKLLLSSPQSYTNSWNFYNSSSTSSSSSSTPTTSNTSASSGNSSKLNSLDFRRMNTVAIPSNESTWNMDKFHKKNFDLTEREMHEKYFLDTVDRVARENRKTEQTMMSIFQSESQSGNLSRVNSYAHATKSCLNRRTDLSHSGKREPKSVRFLIDDDVNKNNNKNENIENSRSKNVYLLDGSLNENISCKVEHENFKLFTPASITGGPLKRLSSHAYISTTISATGGADVHVETGANISNAKTINPTSEGETANAETTQDTGNLKVDALRIDGNRVTSFPKRISRPIEETDNVRDLTSIPGDNGFGQSLNSNLNRVSAINKSSNQTRVFPPDEIYPTATTTPTPTPTAAASSVMEPKDDTKNDRDFSNQNGALKTNDLTNCEKSKDTSKTDKKTSVNPVTSTECLQLSVNPGDSIISNQLLARMPHGSRARKTRRNRNKRVKHGPQDARSERTLHRRDDVNNDVDNADKDEDEDDKSDGLAGSGSSQVQDVTSKTREEESIVEGTESSIHREDIESSLEDEVEKEKEAKVNGHAVKVTSEVESPSSTNVIRSIASANKPPVGQQQQQQQRVPVRRRHRLERRALDTPMKIYEITSISGPLAASIGHIAGVGIVESASGFIDSDDGGSCGHQKTSVRQQDPIVTISEPLEPLEPLPSDMTQRLETLGEREFAQTLMPVFPRNANREGLEICELDCDDITSDITEELSARPSNVVIVEADSDVETKEPTAMRIKDVIVEESSFDETDSEAREITRENYFKGADAKVEIGNEDEEVEKVDCREENVGEEKIIVGEESMDQVEPDNCEKILGQRRISDETDGDDGGGRFESKETIECKESADRMKCSMGTKCQESDGFNNDLKLKESSEIHEPRTATLTPLTQELQNKLGVFIEGLELPYFHDDDNLLDNSISLFDNRRSSQLFTFPIQINTINNICNDNNNSNRREKVRKRSILESYFAEARHADRFLDIIQEEADKLSEDEEQHIRDFINEEIGKFHRERRYTHDSEQEEEKGEKTEENEQDDDDDWECEDDKYLSVEIQDLKVSPDIQTNITLNEKPAEKIISFKSGCSSPDEINKLISNNEKSYSPENLHHSNDNNNNNNNSNNNKGNKVEDLTSTARQPVPPEPPKRSSSFISRDIEPVRPPTPPFPPQMDYPLAISESSARVNQFSLGLDDTCDKPARPPLPLLIPSNSSDWNSPFSIYEISQTVEQQKRERNCTRGGKEKGGQGGVSSKENTSALLRNEAYDGVEIGNDANNIEASWSCPEIAYDHSNSDLSATMSASHRKISSSDLSDGRLSLGISACESQRVLSLSPQQRFTSAVVTTTTTTTDTTTTTAASETNTTRAFVEYRRKPERHEGVESSRPFGNQVSCEKNKNLVEVEVDKEEEEEVKEKEKESVVDEKNLLETLKLKGEKPFEKKPCSVDSISFKVKSVIEDHNEHDCEPENLGESAGKRRNETEEFRVNTASESDKAVSEWGNDGERGAGYQRSNAVLLRYQVDVENNQSTSGESREAAGGIADDTHTTTATVEFLKTDDDASGGHESSSTVSPNTVKYVPPDTCDTDFVLVNSEIANNPSVDTLLDKNISKASSTCAYSYSPSSCYFNSLECTNSRSPVKDLYYVPLHETCDYSSKQEKYLDSPSSLTDLCIRKILSMPYGIQIINEITHPKFNISTDSEKTFGDIKSSELEEVDSAGKVLEMIKRRPKSWMGVPTSENPQLLVCLSPSQQKLNISSLQLRTSDADKLLDLHKKFLNRRSYHETTGDHRRCESFTIPKYYRVQVNSSKDLISNTCAAAEVPEKDVGFKENKLKSKCNEWNQSNRVTTSSSNRLLKIIKENPIATLDDNDNEHDNGYEHKYDHDDYSLPPTKDSVASNPHKNVRQDRTKTTRLSDWLTLARNDPTDYSKYQKISSCHFTGERVSCQDNQPASAFSPVNRRDQNNKNSNNNDNNNNHKDVDNDGCHPRVNSALIIRSADVPNEIINTAPLNKSPITYKSAIIDKSSAVEHCKRTPLLCRGIDPGQVNPALINNNKPETPPRPSRIQRTVVDRSCIDTTSIFDQTPPRSYLEPRRYDPETEALKPRQAISTTTSGTTSIVGRKMREDDKENKHQQTVEENLKRFRTAKDIKDLADGRRRYSLPPELFDRQLEYVERLEDKLKKVILTEKTETKMEEKEVNRVFKEFDEVKTEMALDEDKSSHDRALKASGCSEMGDNRKESWKNESKVDDKGRTEFMKNEGYLEQSTSVEVGKDGERIEKSIRMFENKEECWRTLKNENVARQKIGRTKCIRFFDREDEAQEKRQEKEDVFSQSRKIQKDTYEGKMFDDNKMIKRQARPKSISIFPTTDETLRGKMYDEYRDKVLEREERKHQKVIKISSHVDFVKPESPDDKNNLANNMSSIQKEFIQKAKNRMNKFGINLDDSETEIVQEQDTETSSTCTYTSATATTKTTRSQSQIITSEVKEKNKYECRGDEKAKCLIDGKEIKDVGKLPKHLQEFLVLADTEDHHHHRNHNHQRHHDHQDGYGIATGEKTNDADLLQEIDTALGESKGFLLRQGVWSPGSSSEPPSHKQQPSSPDRGKNTERDAGIPPVWTPSSAGASPVAERKEFRPVTFESPILGRRKKAQAEQLSQPPWKNEHHQQETENKNSTSSNGTASNSTSYNISPRIVNSHSVPSQGLNTLATTPRLPRAQNPTITLLQKAREGQLPKGAAYLTETASYKNNDTADDIIYTVKEYEKKPKEEEEDRRKMENPPRKIQGIGPTTKDGIPVALRSEVKDDNQAKWYKQMYDSLHRAGKDDDYVTIRYKPRRGFRYGHGSASGYLSEPEPRAYADKSATLDIRRRQRNKENDSTISTMPRKSALVKTTAEVYRNQPGRIENYQPGQSTIGEKETKELTMTKKKKWWDEVMDIFDRAEEKKSQLRHPMALRTFIPTHQLLVRSGHHMGTATTVTSSSSSTQSLHPKSSLRTTRAILEHTACDSDESNSQAEAIGRDDCQPSVAYRAEPPSVSLLLGRSKSIITNDRMPYTLLKSSKSGSGDRNSSTRNRRHARDSKHGANHEANDDDAIVIGFIDETVKPDDEQQRHSSSSIEEKLKSLAINSSPTRRSPLLTNRSSSSSSCSNKLTDRSSLFVPATSPRNFRNHQHTNGINIINNNSNNNQRQLHDPSISSSTSSSSSSTIHITMLPPPPPPITNNTVAETALTSPSRPFDQHNPHTAKPYMSHALKESGYESDSTLIFRRRDDVSPLSPLEQRLAYKTVQKGGDVPLHGLRKLAPERPKDDTEIQYFPISSTLTRIRVRRKNNQSTTSSMSSASMSCGRYKRPSQSAATSSVTRVNTSTARSNARPPSPPRRQSSKHNATLKLYISTTGYPQAPNRHQQCFAAESVSNIRFLRERLSNKLLKHEQGRDIARKSFTSFRTVSITPTGSRSKLSTPTCASTSTSTCTIKSTTCAKRKSEACLTKRSCESVKSVSPASSCSPRAINSQRGVVNSKQAEDKSSLSKVQSKSASGSQDTSIAARQGYRSKSYPTSSSQKKDNTKIRRGKKDTEESSKRVSTSAGGSSSLYLSSSSSSHAEVGGRLVLNGRRQVDVENTLTGSVVKSSSLGLVSPSSVSSSSLSLRRAKSQDTGLSSSKVIFKSRELEKTARSSSNVVIRSRSPASASGVSSVASVTSRRGNFVETCKQKSSTSKLVKSSSGVTTIATPQTSVSKKNREKFQSGVKSPLKKSQVIEDQEIKFDKKKSGMKKDKLLREGSAKKKSNGKSDSEKKKIKKTCEKLLAVDCLKKVDKKVREVNANTAQQLTMDRIKKHQEVTRTDNFFQNLFLRNISSSPTSSQCSTPRRSSVIERARMFQEVGGFNNPGGFKSEPSLRSLNVYLATKQPVSNSRFKNWERESFSSRSSSPFGVSWPGRSVFQKITKFDSLQGITAEFGSSSSLRGSRSPELERESIVVKERSLSEPPLKVSMVDEKITRRVKHLPPRSPSPSPTRSAASRRIRSFRQDDTFPQLKARARSASEVEDEQRRKITFGSNLSLTKSTSSLESYPANKEEYQRYVFEMLHSKKKSSRYKDLHDFYASLERMGELEKTTSASDLRRRFKHEDIIDYDEWKEIRSTERAEQELKSIYGKLRAVQREKDFLFSTKDLDKYRWRGDCSLRCKERSVENIRESFRRLAREESELESTRRREISSRKDIYKPLWRGNSVVNVATTMTRRANSEGKQTMSQDEPDKSRSAEPSYLQKNLGGSKKFWSSLSVEQVNALKNQLNEIYGSEDKPKMYTKSFDVEEKISFTENIKQTNKTGTCATIPTEIKTSAAEFEVVVPSHEFGDGLEEVTGLSVRCHSMLVPATKSSGKLSSSLKRSDSISNGRNLQHRHTSRATSLSEGEKKRLSLTLGKEILDKVSQRKNSKSPVTPRETLGAIAAASAKSTAKNISQSTPTINTSPRTCYSLETSVDDDTSKSRDKSDFLLVLTPNGDSPATRRRVENVLDEWSKKPPLLAVAVSANEQIRNASSSEMDSTTESSENSVKTVVQCEENKTDVVPKKVEFFESIEREKKWEEKSLALIADSKRKKNKLSSSQSFADLKELFGEMESARYGSLACNLRVGGQDTNRTACQSTISSPGGSEHSTRGKGRSTSASPDVPTGRFSSGSHSREYFVEHTRPRSVSPCRVSTSTCSLESLQHRSYSPDPEHYWRAYLNLVKHGAVRKLRAKFESLEELSGGRVKFTLSPKRFQSDPEITRNLLKKTEVKKSTGSTTVLKTQEVPDVAWLRRKYEPGAGARGKAKRRLTRSPPIPRIPLRFEDLAMPHINVISKTAELKDSAMSRSSSSNSLAIKAETEELEARRPVGRIRDKFEKEFNLSDSSNTCRATSILGEMFTSTPDVHELRDIAPYLAGRWVAHKYPSRRDNARSLSLPPDLESRSLDKTKTSNVKSSSPGNSASSVSASGSNTSGRTTLPRATDKVKGPRAVSVSPVRSRTPTSILKQRQTDPFANQPFDPSKHRPKFRYQPPPPTPPPPDPASLRPETRATWWPAIPTYTAKPTVTFEGPHARH